MGQVGERIDGHAALMDQGLGNGLAGERSEMGQKGVRVADADGRGADDGRQAELLFQIGRGLAALITAQRHGAHGVGRAFDILDGGLAVGDMVARRHHGRVKGLDLEQHRGLDAHDFEQVLDGRDVAGVDPAGKDVELAAGFGLLGEIGHDVAHGHVVAGDHAADEARGVDGDEMDLAAGVLFLEQAVIELGDHAVDVVADDLGGAGGDDGHYLDVGIAHEEHVHGLLHPAAGPEHRAILVDRGRGQLEALLEMLGEDEPHEHDAALAAMDDADAVLDADADELRPGRLAGEDGIDDAGPGPFHEFASHMPFLLKKCSMPVGK